MTRILTWLGASILVVGCRYVVSFDDLSSGGAPSLAAGNGGSGGGDGPSTGGAGMNSGGTGAGGTGGTIDLDGSVEDVRADGTPLGATLVYEAPAGASIRGITVFGADLYWVEGGSTRGVFRMPKDGQPSDLLQIRRTPSAFDVAVDANFIYWSDGGDFLVWQMPITGGVNTMPTMVFAHNSTVPRYIAVDDRGIVYVTTSTGGSGSILSGGMGSSAHPYAAQDSIAGIAFYADVDAGAHKLIWGYATGIKEGPTQGPTVPMDVQDLNTGLSGQPVQGVAMDGQRMYWISNSNAVRKGEPSKGSAGPWCVTGQDLGPYADITVDDSWVYFTWPSKNQIYKCAK